ncbi:MAG TPA: Rrf2 family transcriptional regulator, partial [Pseudomonadales bacterium]|nr:Rrf2 family transcriptional regulator [Pseudomonadales bacterium]
SSLVRSERGVHGGYQLSRLPELISVAEIISAIEGPIALTECSDGATDCDRIGSCDMESSWPAINGLIYQLLRTLRLSDIEYTRGGQFDIATLLQRLQRRDCPFPA